MKKTTFKEWVAQRDVGFLLPNRPPLELLPRINTTPYSDAQRKRFQPKVVKKPIPLAPTILEMKEIVPQRLIPRNVGRQV